MKLEVVELNTDILIIGGGAAGCFSALTISKNSNRNVIIAEKANIERSGCLAAGVNALNAYITEDETVDSYVDYVKRESENIIREDLTYTIGERLNSVTEKIEQLGLPILKDENGKYVTRGKRSIKINGENIKPILASSVAKCKNVTTLNQVNICDYIKNGRNIIGAYGFSVLENKMYVIYSKATICATGGASGIYKPNNPGFSRHKMWYSPFNTGAGYAMGIRAGAEMTSFEMRFIALRCKDTIAPTGTVAQGLKAEQVNAKGEDYVSSYGKPTTINRLHSTIEENAKGNGPCFIKTEGISKEVEDQLFRAYLNMAPSQTLKWIESGNHPSKENIEVEGTEPYIVGGHTGSGYWIDSDRKTTLCGLYAVGDVAGGSPKKYVTGCFAEGEIAAESALEYMEDKTISKFQKQEIEQIRTNLEKFLEDKKDTSQFGIKDIEEAMQKIMDEYAGGISTQYGYNEERLDIALEKLEELTELSEKLKAQDMHELLFIKELLDRLIVSKVLVHHLKARKETRWEVYQKNLSYRKKDDENYLNYINTVYHDGDVRVIKRDLVRKGEHYEH